MGQTSDRNAVFSSSIAVVMGVEAEVVVEGEAELSRNAMNQSIKYIS